MTIIYYFAEWLSYLALRDFEYCLLNPRNQPKIPLAVADIAVTAPVNGFTQSSRKALTCSFGVNGSSTVTLDSNF